MRLKAWFVSLLSVSAMTASCAVGVQDDVSDESQLGASARADSALQEEPFYLTGAFDGSQSFRMWADTVQYAREFKARFGRDLHFTYFINTCFYDTTVQRSDIGRAQSRGEVLARFGMTQQAINEGHEIGSHAVRHKDGGSWSEAQWRAELTEFDELAESNLFEPIYDQHGEPVFPRYDPVTDSPRQLGASCETDSDCNSGMCIPHSATKSFCSRSCNRNNPCSTGMACGQPTWNTDKDYCMMIPQFPVIHNGETLFDEDGNPNLQSRQLRSYQMRGFRAPLLANNSHLYDVLESMDYVYDTSHILGPAAPNRVKRDGKTWGSLYEFPLMRYTTSHGVSTSSLTVPMDYNYYANQSGTANDAAFTRMQGDYRRSIVAAYKSRRPWNIGHHFSLWKGGAYWRAMKDAFEFAASGCPSANGTMQCGDDVEFPSFIELANHLDEADSRRGDGTEETFNWDGDESEGYASPGLYPDASEDWSEDMHIE